MSKAKENSQIASKLLSDVGSIVTADSDSLELLSPGTDGQVLTADSTVPNGIKWATAGASGFTPTQVTDLTDSGDTTLHYHTSDRNLTNATGTLAVANGGTASTTAQTAINLLTNVAGATAGDVLTKSGIDAVWLAPSGAGIGDVTGPASSVDNNLANFNGTSGKTIEDSGIAISNVATKTGTETLTNKTMSTGSTWSGNAVGALYGGTAQTSYTKGDILYSSAANTLAKLPVGTLDQVLSVSSSGIPNWKTLGAISGTTTFTGIADFVLGPGATKISGTDNSAAMDTALATKLEIYVPAGNYWISSLTTRYNMSFAHITGPGVLWGYTNVGYAKLGKTLNIGTIRSHEMASVGGLHIGGEDGALGMRQWMGHHNWMQFQPYRYGAPAQVQLYSSNPIGFFYPIAYNQIRACYGDGSLAYFPLSSSSSTNYGIDVGDIFSAGGIQYIVSAITAETITLAARAGGLAPSFSAGDISAKTIYVWSTSYETSTGTCNASGSTITWTGGEEIVMIGEHGTIRFVGDPQIYTVTSFNWSTNQLTISGSKTGTNLQYLQKGHDWGTYQTLLRLQGAAGGYETNCFINYSPNQDMIIGNNGAPNHIGKTHFFLNAGGTFGRHYWSFNTGPSYSSHTHLGESLRISAWNAYTDHLTVYGSVSGVNNGPNIAAEGTSANLDISLTPKGTGAVQIGVATKDDTSNWYVTGVDGYWSNNGTHLKIGAASNSVNPPVWVQNTTSWNSGIYDHYASCALFETIKTTGASCPNSLTGSIKVSGGTGDAIGIHGQVVVDITTGGAMTGIWGRATGPTLAPTSGMICGVEVNVDNRHGTTSYKARKDAGSLVGMLIYNFSGAGKANHFGFVIEGTATDAYHVGGLIEDWSTAALKLTATRSNSYGILIDSEVNNYTDKGIAFGAQCATAGIALGNNKFNFGDYTGATFNNGDMWVNGGILYIKLGGVNRQVSLV